MGEATWKLTPTHAPVARASITVRGVRGSGFTSPLAPITEMVHEDPVACEHCCATVPPCGSVDGAAPTRRMSRTGATAVWLVTETTAASSEPGTARSAPMTVTVDPSSETSNAEPEYSTAYRMPLQSSRSCQLVMLRRSNVAVSPGPTVIDPARSSGCGSSAFTMIGTDR